MSFNMKLVVVGFTLALLFVSYANAAALCEERTGIMCTSDEMCVTICLQKGGYIGGYCSTQYVVGDPSCVCKKTCGGGPTAAAGDESPAEKPATVGRQGMGNYVN